MPPIRWQPDRTPKLPPWPLPPFGTAIGRGLLGRCPACGKSHLFNGFLRVVPECQNCGAPLGLARADDAPPYFTILIVGHIVIPLDADPAADAGPADLGDVGDLPAPDAVPGARLAAADQGRHRRTDAAAQHAEIRRRRAHEPAPPRLSTGSCWRRTRRRQPAAADRGRPRPGGRRPGGRQPLRPARREARRRRRRTLRPASGDPRRPPGVRHPPRRRRPAGRDRAGAGAVPLADQGLPDAGGQPYHGGAGGPHGTHPGDRHGTARLAQRRRRADAAAPARQDRHRLRHRPPSVHPALRAAPEGLRRDEDRRRGAIAASGWTARTAGRCTSSTRPSCPGRWRSCA